MTTVSLSRNGTDLGSWVSGSTVMNYSSLKSIWGKLALAMGSNTFIAMACDGSFQCAADTISVTRTSSSPPVQAAPVATLAQSSTSRHVDACATCASRLLAYSTPAEVVGGVPRGVTLRYSSELAKPVGYVEIDARIRATSSPTRLSIRVRRVSTGAYVTLSNGATEAFVAVSDTGTYRLAAQFDASGSDYPTTGAYDFDVVVGSYWGSGTSYLSDTVQARILIEREPSASPYGQGWAIAGLARINPQSNNVVLSDGNGGLWFYSQSSCSGTPQVCSYLSPTGVFSTLTKTIRTGADSAVWHLAARDGSVQHFNDVGLLVQNVDRLGNSVRFGYDTLSGNQHRLKKVRTLVRGSGSYEREISLAYTSGGTLNTITLPDTRASQFIVSSGLLTTVLDPGSDTALKVTYLSGRATTAAGRNKAADSVTFDAFGQVSEVRTPSVVTEADGAIRLTTAIASLRMKLLTGLGTTSGGAASAGVRADSAYQKITAPNGTVTFTWSHVSGVARRMETREPSGRSTYGETTFNTNYQPVRLISTGRGPVDYSWSGPLLVEELDVMSGSRTTYTYRKYDQVDSVVADGVRRLRNYFSGDSLLPDSTRVDSADVTRFKYDSDKRLVSVRNSVHAKDSVQYESTFGNINRLVQLNSMSSMRETRLTLNASGRDSTMVDPEGDTLRFYYDKVDRDTLAIAAGNNRTSQRYEDAINRFTTVDAKGQRYIDSTNALGWVITRRDTLGLVDSTRYDRLGGIVRERDAKGGIVTFTRDSLGRVTRRVAGADTAWFRYDTAGRWSAARNLVSRDSVTLDQARRISGIYTWRGSASLTLSYDYTATGLPSRLWVRRYSGATQIWARNFDYAYDAFEKLNLIKDAAAKSTSISYTRSGQPETISLPHGRTITLGYDAWDRLASQSYSPSAANIAFYRQVERDSLSRITRELRQAGKERRFVYDSLGRVTSYSDLQASQWSEYYQIPNDPYGDCPGCFILDSIVHYDTTVVRNETYTYDAVGNRTDRNATIAAGNRVTFVDGYTLVHDAAGYLTQKAKYADTLKLTWSVAGQLTQAYSKRNGTGTTTLYTYDATGRRIQKKVNGVATNYLYEGDQIVVEMDSSLAIIAEYTYYPGTDRPHSMKRGGKMYYYAQDPSGNIIGLLDTAGVIKATYEYSAYGESVGGSQAIENPFRFKGREWDESSRLYFMRARYYDPHLGRFVSKDPIGLAGGVNSYSFVDGDPVNLADPTGLLPTLPTVWIIARQHRGGGGGGGGRFANCPFVDYDEMGMVRCLMSAQSDATKSAFQKVA